MRHACCQVVLVKGLTNRHIKYWADREDWSSAFWENPLQHHQLRHLFLSYVFSDYRRHI